MRGPTSDADLGVYVHVPFCERVCPYCDFAVEGVGALAAGRAARYVDDLLRELDLARSALGPEVAGRALATIYLGGGTPSLLPPGELARLLEAIRAHWPGEPREVTLELNPGRLEVERAGDLAAIGVTRASVGVQSLDDDVLRRLGRAHSAADARAGLDACLAAFGRVSADLIHGAPGQSRATLLRDTDALLRAGVEHLSAYALTIEPGTPFARARAAGRLALPDEDAAFEMGAALEAALAAAGLERYEISSWARPGAQAQHNQRYWLRHDVLGLGVSAASLVGARRMQSTRDLAGYTAAVRSGRLAWEQDEQLDLEEQRREALYLGLRRMEGVDLAAYADRYGAAPAQLFARELHELGAADLIEQVDGALRLTPRGLRFADEVFSALV